METSEKDPDMSDQKSDPIESGQVRTTPIALDEESEDDN